MKKILVIMLSILIIPMVAIAKGPVIWGWGGSSLSSYTDITTFFATGGGACSGYLKSDGTCDSPAGSGSVATDTIFDAAGDLVQGTGADTSAKLIKGAAGTILRAGATSNAYSTSTYADTFVIGGILHAAAANTIAALAPGAVGSFLMSNGNAAALSYLAAGAANQILVGAGVTTIPVWTSSSANMISLLGSADYSTARTNLGLAIGTDVQGYNANTVVSSGAITANHMTCFSADGLSVVDCGALVTMGTGVATAAAINIGTAGSFLVQGVTPEKIATFYWDGGASAMTTGATTKRCVQVPFAATITGVYIKASTSSTLTITPYKDAFATGALATTALISGAGTIGVTTALGVHDTTLTGWTTSVSAGDEVCAQVTTNDNALWISMQIHGTR